MRIAYLFIVVCIIVAFLGGVAGYMTGVAYDETHPKTKTIPVTATPPSYPVRIDPDVLAYLQDCQNGLCIGSMPQLVAVGAYEPIGGIVYKWTAVVLDNGRPVLIVCTPAPVVCGQAEAVFNLQSVPFGIDTSPTPNPYPTNTPGGYAPIESTVDPMTPLPTSNGS